MVSSFTIVKNLSDVDVRIFRIQETDEYRTHTDYLVHANKSAEDFRNDIREFLKNHNTRPPLKAHNHTNPNGSVYFYLQNLGYIDIMDICSESWESEIVNNKTVPRPDNAEVYGPEGFGHGAHEAQLIQQLPS
jgi:hypothetical protein